MNIANQKFWIMLAGFTLISFNKDLQAKIFTIKLDGSGNYTKIQAGINVASAGDTILVHPGTYTENLDFNGKKIVLGSLFLTTADTTFISKTIIDGNKAGSVILLQNREDVNTAVVGLTIQNSASANAGISLLNSGATIKNCNIIKNAGEGIYALNDSYSIIENNRISNNGSFGVYFGYGARGIVRSNSIVGNRSGISIYLSSPSTIEKNIISSNSGGGIDVDASGATIRFNLINNNGGQGIYCGRGTQIINCTIANNLAGIILQHNSTVKILNSIIWGNQDKELALELNANGTWDVTYSLVKGGWPGTGNISTDPLFRGGTPYDYNLTSLSLCIDAGDPASPLDPDGTRADMGAFYFRQGMNETFIEIPTVIPGLQLSSVAWGDYDSDSDLDILLTGFTGSDYISRIYRNDGGTFVNVAAPITQVLRGAAIWGDYDNDGDLDILLTGDAAKGQLPQSPVSLIYRNEGGSFVNIGASLIGVYISSVAWGDYDNDGDLDILMSGFTGSSYVSKIYRNDSGAFVDIADPNLVGVHRGSVAWGDYDNDGDLDILLAGEITSARVTKIYRNDGGRFIDISAPLTGAFWGSVAWGDYDSDGDLDILLTGNTASTDNPVPITKVYRNNAGTFVDISAPLKAIYYSSGSFGDYDNDGDLDILLVGYDGNESVSKVYQNNGGNFVDIAAPLLGADEGSSAWGDYDNDGDLDILINGGGRIGFVTKIYRNNIGTTNTVPTPPSNLASSVVGNIVTLSWNKSTDKETAQNGLTYNLRVGTTPGGSEIVSPMANVNTGFRKIPQLGNINHNSRWTIKNLPAGKYYWSVQAIDNAFAGSPFAGEQSFVIGGIDQTPPAAPQGLAAIAGDRQITLKWRQNTEADFLRYRIYRGTSPNPTTKVDSTNSIADTTKTFAGLSNGTKYYFRLTAVDQNLNQSGFSNEVSATPTLIDLSPAPPKNLTATAGDKQITLKWDANSELDLLRYRIYGGIAPNPTTAIDSVLAALGTTKIITGLNNGTKYYFRLTAVDLLLNVSGYSNEVSATPTTGPAAPNAPTNLAATPVSSTQINLTWSDNSSNETSFEIERKTGAGGAYAVIATRPGDASTGADNYSNTGLSPNTAYFYRVRAVLNTVTPILYSNYSNEISATTFPAIPAAPSNLAASAISNSQIRLSWNATGVTGEEGFRIYRSTSAGVAIIAGNLVGSVGINIETFTDTGLSATNTYYYKVVAFNVSGNSAPSNEASATPAGDKTPPTLSAVSYAQKVNLNTDATVSLSITDLSGIKNATLYYRSGGAASFSSRAMTLQTGSTYTQTIPATAVTNRGVEFYVAAEDGAGNLSQSPSYPIQVYCPNGIANPNAQPSGKDAGAYRIFSIPLDLDNKSPAAFLNANSTLGAYDNTKYRWYGLERSTQRLQEYPNFGSITMAPDMGFALLVSLQNLKLKTPQGGATVVTTRPYNIALPAGWSLIGNPFNYNIPFDSLRVSAGTFELWSFEGDWQINSAGLETWKGYAIWLSQAATFSIRAGLAGLRSATSFYAVENNDAENWLIQITAENGRSASRFNFVGQNEMARDDEDQFDLHQPLRLTDGVELVFNQQFTTDIRQSSANGHTWEMTCELNPADEMLSLAFEGIHSVPPRFEIFLIDLETQTAYDLRRNQSLQFATRHLTEKRFQLIAGTKTYLNSQELEAELHPSNYVLLQNFPNPFNPSTQIIYSLPEASHVEVSVYNLRGERVATLVNEPKESGSHSVVWNAEKVGSGVYLIRIRAGRFESMKKCLLVK